MAIYYGNGTLNPASTTLAHDVRRAWKVGFDNAIAAGKTNWTVTEHDFVASGATTQRTVLSNSLGFVLCIITSTTSSTTTIQAYISSTYATPTMSGLGMGLTSDGSFVGLSGGTDANGISTLTFNPTALQGGTLTPQPHGSYQSFAATGAQTAYTVHIENDYAILSFNDGSASKGKWLFAGKYTTLVANTGLPSNTIDKPFCLAFSTSSNTANQVVYVQSPGNPSITFPVSAGTFRPGGKAWSLGSNGAPADNTQIDKYSLNPTYAKVAPIYLSRDQYTIDALTTNNGATAYGWLNGKLTGMYNAGWSNANYGDTIAIGGKTYMYIGGTSKTNPIAGWALIN